MAKFKKWVSNNYRTGMSIVNAGKSMRQDAKDLKNGKTTVGKLIKKRFVKKTRQKAIKLGLQSAKAIITFLFTTPPGWITLGIIAILLGSSPSNLNNNKDYVNGRDGTTTNQYTALMVQDSCATKGPDADDSISLGNVSGGKLSFSQIEKFANSGIKSTWGVSISKAEAYFLSRNSRIAAKYGLSKSNIGSISKIVENEGVSPVFFWLYSVNENGGAGGFINHYTSDTGNAKTDARTDAAYIYQKSHDGADRPATKGGEPLDMPTDHAAKIYKSVELGSIGKVYIPATSAVTAEIETAAGHKGAWSGKYNSPISEVYNAIKSLGGDPGKIVKPDNKNLSAGAHADKSAGVSDDDSSGMSGSECNDKDTDNGDLADGGMALEKARSFMSKYYHTKLSASDYAGAAPGEPDVHDNCTVFSAYFITNYTSIKTGGGNGKDVAENLVKANGNKLKLEHKPVVYSIFSIQPNQGGVHNIALGDAGHTGVVLGIDKKKGVAIIGQGEYGHAFTSTSDWNSGANAQEIPLKVMDAEHGWSFVNVNKYLKKGNLKP